MISRSVCSRIWRRSTASGRCSTDKARSGPSVLSAAGSGVVGLSVLSACLRERDVRAGKERCHGCSPLGAAAGRQHSRRGQSPGGSRRSSLGGGRVSDGRLPDGPWVRFARRATDSCAILWHSKIGRQRSQARLHKGRSCPDDRHSKIVCRTGDWRSSGPFYVSAAHAGDET